MVEKAAKVVKINIHSSAFQHDQMIPKDYTGQGADVSPPLAWAPIPVGTKSLALIIDDPDAPAGNWVHWMVKNIPPEVKEFDESSYVGEIVANSWGKKKYMGPMPPKGTHRYVHKIFALNIEKMEATNLADFYKEVEKHKTAEGSLVAKYKKT